MMFAVRTDTDHWHLLVKRRLRTARWQNATWRKADCAGCSGDAGGNALLQHNFRLVKLAQTDNSPGSRFFEPQINADERG
jgi:hypothetical protein